MGDESARLELLPDLLPVLLALFPLGLGALRQLQGDLGLGLGILQDLVVGGSNVLLLLRDGRGDGLVRGADVLVLQETDVQVRRLRELRDSLNEVHPMNAGWSELSMGMSGDFELAIAEGATLVRIGSMLFEGVL